MMKKEQKAYEVGLASPKSTILRTIGCWQGFYVTSAGCKSVTIAAAGYETAQFIAEVFNLS